MLSSTLEKLRQQGNLRFFRPLSGRNGCRVVFNNTMMVNMTSNDYLGIASDDEILASFYSDLNEDNLVDHYGLGAASSRLLTGDIPVSHLLETEIASQYGRGGALLFNSGYHANIGILPAIAQKKDLILSDKLNHASIIDGLRLSRATHRRYGHLDYPNLRNILERIRDDYDRVIIVSESVFSMDGDVADLHQLVDIKNHFNCLLYVDEAHSVGVYGKRGLGKAEEQGLIDEIDFLIGTFGKAYGSVGAYVVCDEEVREFLINHSRSLIFTTALPPVVYHWNYSIFKKVLTMNDRREKLAEISSRLRSNILSYNLKTGGETNIIPVVIGDSSQTKEVADKLQKKGYLIFAIRPPTVPEGTSRFRLSLTADMEWEDISSLPSVINEAIRKK